METKNRATFDIPRGVYMHRLGISLWLWQREQVVKEARVSSQQGFVHAKERVFGSKDNLELCISAMSPRQGWFSQIHPRTTSLDA